MTLGDRQARLLELFDRLPPEVQGQAIEAIDHLTDRDAHAGAFGWLLGYHYVDAELGHARCILDVTDIHLNSSGVAHGGVLCTLADAAMGAAAYNSLEPDQRCVTAELKVNFLKPIVPGRVTAGATIVQKGTRLIVVTAEMHDEAGDLVGIALGTFAIIARDRRRSTELA
jgi:uncharacterized protein (TIGR00369 family)